MLFENNWLARYPQPSHCTHDNGGEFTVTAFLHMLHVNGIKDVTTTVKNPQNNAICEKLHQLISKTLWTLFHTYSPNNIDQPTNIMDTCFATTSYASKIEIHCTLNMSLGAFWFSKIYDTKYSSHHISTSPLQAKTEYIIISHKRNFLRKHLRTNLMMKYES